MKPLMTQITSTLSGAVVFVMGCVLAGLGLATVGVLAVFALAVVGLGLLSAPFVALTQPRPVMADTAAQTAAQTATQTATQTVAPASSAA